MVSVNILIAFEKAISLPASILIASADALIVVEHTIKKKRKRKYMLFSPVLFFCCHVVTLSHTASNSLNKNRLQA